MFTSMAIRRSPSGRQSSTTWSRVRKRMREIAVLVFEGRLIAGLREYWSSERLGVVLGSGGRGCRLTFLPRRGPDRVDAVRGFGERHAGTGELQGGEPVADMGLGVCPLIETGPQA